MYFQGLSQKMELGPELFSQVPQIPGKGRTRKFRPCREHVREDRDVHFIAGGDYSDFSMCGFREEYDDGRSIGYAFHRRGASVLKQVLREFLSIEGVTSAALVGRDGFAIEVVGTRPPNPDTLGALCSDSVRFFEKSGEAMKMDALRQIQMEYRDGVLLLTPLTRDEFLVILTNTSEGLGRLSYQVAKTGSRVAAAI
jgi:uncharacterized protein